MPEAVVTQVGYIAALVVVSSVIAVLVALVAVVAVEALPAKFVVVRVAVEGLKLSFVDDTFWGRFPVAAVTHVGYIVALVAVSSVTAVLVALVALPDKAPENVVVVKVAVEGLKVSFEDDTF